MSERCPFWKNTFCVNRQAISKENQFQNLIFGMMGIVVVLLDCLRHGGPPSITPLLRKAFLHLWEKEQAQGSYQVEYDTQDALMYALGRRGALGALHGIALPPQRLRLSMLYLALGYLHADERFNDLYHYLVSNEAFKQEVKLVLAEHFALSEEECQDYVNSYGRDYFARMDHMGKPESDEQPESDGQAERDRQAESEQYRGFE